MSLVFSDIQQNYNYDGYENEVRQCTKHFKYAKGYLWEVLIIKMLYC